jgi:hypothetical protein
MVSQCRELKGSFSVAFRIHFAERLLPELCSRLERARGLAQHDETFRQAAGAYQGLLLDSQVLQLSVAVMSMAESADRAGQPSGQIERILELFARQMWPLLQAGLSEEPKRIERALAEHGAAYGAWVAYVQRWSGQVQSGAQQVQTAKYVWDAAMLVFAAHEAATGLASLVKSGGAPLGPSFATGGAGAATLNPTAYVQPSEALQKLIAQGALDATVIAGLGRMIPPMSAGGMAAAGLPDPSVPTSFAMGREKSTKEATKYARPSGATTPAQRASVQGKPCVDCDATAPKMHADHKTPLVKQHYEGGGIDKTQMRSPDAVQPQCPTCSNRQGADLSRYSRAKAQELDLEQ